MLSNQSIRPALDATRQLLTVTTEKVPVARRAHDHPTQAVLITRGIRSFRRTPCSPSRAPYSRVPGQARRVQAPLAEGNHVTLHREARSPSSPSPCCPYCHASLYASFERGSLTVFPNSRESSGHCFWVSTPREQREVTCTRP